MKKIFVAFAGSALMLTSVSSCASSQATVSSTGSALKSVASQATQQLTITYLTQKLAGQNPTLKSVLAGATANTSLASILGAGGQNTSLLSSLVSSQFGLSNTSVTNALNTSGTLGNFANFLGTNTNASTLTSLLSGLR